MPAAKAVITPEAHRRIEQNVCAYVPFKPLLREGAEIEEIYKTVDGVVIGQVIVRQSVCDSLGGAGPP